VGFHRKHYP